ncbi:MAG: accessory gene regulator B family protein [Clostridia bacterium]|nr:accessory gene regulator B family protein [Clostridia bacterium]
MIDKICAFLTQKIRKEMPDIDEEKAEVINYGLQNLLGEIPKTFIMLLVAYILGVFKWAFFTFVALFIYKGASGGVHLKTHIGCIIFTCTFYCIIPFISKYIVMSQLVKNIVIAVVWIFGIIMIKLYAPADTESVPILQEKVRKKKRIVSYISFSIALLVAAIVPNNMISNILILANFFQTITITKFVYKITNNKYGYEVYSNTSTEAV